MEEADLYRELLLLKIKASKKERSEIKEIVDIYRGRIVDLSNRSLIVEVTGLKRGDRGLDEE